MHASYQIINQVLWLAYITHKHYIYILELMQMQASTWICTYQMQTTKFMSLLPLLVCSSCPLSKNIDPPQYFSLLIHVMSMLALSSPLLLCPNILYLCPNFSPFVINDHKRPDTLWNLFHVKISEYHLKVVSWEFLVAWCKELD